MTSTLTLNNNLPQTSEVTLTIFNSKGEAFTPPPIALEAHSVQRVGLGRLTEHAKGNFTSGSVQVSYHGPAMGVTCQVSIVSERERLQFESIETSTMEFSSSQLDSLVWLPDRSTRANLALTNTTPGDLEATIMMNNQQDRKTEEIELHSHETRVIDLNDILNDEKQTSVPTLVRLHHTGSPGALIATGFVINEHRGFASNFAFVDSATAKSNHLSGAHVRFGRPRVSEGFPEGTIFRAPFVIANIGGAPSEARLFVEYTIESEVKRVELTKVSLDPQALKQIDIAKEMSQRGVVGPIENAGVDIDYSGAPGSVIARLTSVDATGDFSFDVPVKDPLAEMLRVGGNYPWRLDGSYTTGLHLKNTINKQVYALVQVRYEGGSYNLERIKMAPFQTLAIDIKKLRDEQKEDIRGAVMPKDVQGGQVVWFEEEVGSLIGRAEVANIRAGVAGSFSCGEACQCPPSFSSAFLTPGSSVGPVGGVAQFSSKEQRQDCHGTQFGPYDRTSDSTWSSDNTSVAAVSAGSVSCLYPGTANILARFQATVYTMNCFVQTVNPGAGGGVTVTPTVTIGSGPRAVAIGVDGNQISITATGNPSGGTYQWDTPNSSLIRLSNSTSATVTVESISPSSSRNDVTVTVTYKVNNQTAQASTTLTVQKPTGLSLVTTTSQGAANCGSGSSGWQRVVKWQVVDQFGDPMRFASMSVSDSITLGQPNTCGATNPLTGTGFTDVNGQFPDTYSFCSPGCISGNCQLQATQNWIINSVATYNDITVFYTCGSITLNGQ